MKRRYPVCAHCSTVMTPDLHEDVSPGFVVNTELYCSHCFKTYMDEELEWMQSVLEKDPEAVAQAMNISIVRFE